jgi:hypothetical protein
MTTTPTPIPARRGLRRTAGRLLVVLTALVATSAGLVQLSSSPAGALCMDPPCVRDPSPTSSTTRPPVVTRITSISPSFAWSGDVITLSGTGFTGATVTVNGLAASIISQSSTSLTFIVPTLMNTVAGPVTIPVVVTSPTGTASTGFTLSSTLQVGASATYGVNAQFGQGTDGSAWANATLDRSSGFVLSNLTVKSTQFWLSLSINMSTVWLDSAGKVIGFTTPHNVTSTGVFFHWPSGDTTATGTFSEFVGPNPGVGPFAHSAQILLVRDHGQELLTTLQNAVATGQTIAQVVQFLAPFFI